MNEDTAERIAAGAPANVRETFLRTVLPGLGQTLLQVRANPARIKRCNARQARRVISLIDDPTTLADIADHEQRVSVREAIRNNPVWQDTPHAKTCSHCRDEQTLPLGDIERIRAAVGPRDARIAAFGTSDVCHEKILETLKRVEPAIQPELWRTAFTNVLAYSVRAYVELAAGRLPLAIQDAPPWEGSSQAHMRRLLANEPRATRALLDFAITTGSVPSHWDVTDEEWCRVLRERDIVTIGGAHRVPLRAVHATWEQLSSRARVGALVHAETLAELEGLLGAFDEADIDEARGRDALARHVVATIQRFPELEGTRRLGLVAMLPRREIGEYLLGRLGALPEPGQIPDILALYNLGQRTTSHRFLIDQAGRNEAAGEHRETRRALIETLVRTARPGEIFSAANRVSEAAHAYVWEQLDGENSIVAFAGLLEEWAGTLPELVAAARELGR